ncbi:chorismate mutase [Oscillatoria laete-virens NRMC-F 0139]|nr:chorismate mutase [Oscillatoria laete-virens]MDL5055229.1 chorismate mutase [Oscillatoria laete-virens NRMC-F 0139]
MSDPLKNVREKIDSLDSKLLALLNERVKLVLEVGRIKHVSGQDIYAPEREQALLRRLTGMNPGPLPNDSLRAIYREIMSSAISLEKPIVIATPGPESGSAVKAARSKFGKSLRYSLQKDVRAVFKVVTARQADYGVIPVESGGDSTLMDVFDYFIDFPLVICAQITAPGSGPRKVKGEPVRYFVIGRRCPPPTGSDRTTALFSLPDKPGALARALQTLAQAKVNLMKIESRPSWRTGFKYHFVVDLDGHAQEARFQKALAQFARVCNAVKVVGSYPV